MFNTSTIFFFFVLLFEFISLKIYELKMQSKVFNDVTMY